MKRIKYLTKRQIKDVLLKLRATTWKGKLENVYLATIQKTGSQWLRAVMNDRALCGHLGLKEFPQRRYEVNEQVYRFPRGTFVPGLYISHENYIRIKKPERYKTIYVTRDPRNIVISWYWSMKETHPLMGSVPKFRRDLMKLNYDEGIYYCIEKLSVKLNFMKEWLEAEDSTHLSIFKMEELTGSEKGLKRLLDVLGFHDSGDRSGLLYAKYHIKEMRRKDLKRRKDKESHYRRNRTNWKDEMTEGHLDKFYNTTGNLVDLLGYKY